MSQNGSGSKTWNLLEDGLLWKEVVEGTDKEFRDSARILVLQLQEAVKPADALQGMLLDRIASSYFRKQMLLGIESAMRRYQQVKHTVSPKGSTQELQKLSIVAFSSPAQLLAFAENLRFEMFLDQGLHRDLILLEQLRSTSVATQTLIAKGSSKAQRKHADNGVSGPAMIEHR
jgi:hypothetical protein